MSLSLDLAAALVPLVGQNFMPAHAVSVADGSGVSLTVTVISVEALGVACEEIQLDVPTLNAASMDVLKKWGDGLCKRVTYLLENLGPLEYDASVNEVLIRSTPPDTGSPGTT